MRAPASWPMASFFNGKVQSVLEGYLNRPSSFPIVAFESCERLATAPETKPEAGELYFDVYKEDPMFSSNLLVAVSEFHYGPQENLRDLEIEDNASFIADARAGGIDRADLLRGRMNYRKPMPWKQIAKLIEQELKRLKGRGTKAKTLNASIYPREVELRLGLLKKWEKHINAYWDEVNEAIRRKKELGLPPFGKNYMP